MLRYVVMTRDPLLAVGPDPEFAVVSGPLPLDAAREARAMYAAGLGRDPVTRDVGVFLARWEVAEPPPAPRPLNLSFTP